MFFYLCSEDKNKEIKKAANTKAEDVIMFLNKESQMRVTYPQ